MCIQFYLFFVRMPISLYNLKINHNVCKVQTVNLIIYLDKVILIINI